MTGITTTITCTILLLSFTMQFPHIGESSSEPLDTAASADSTTETPSGTNAGGTTETSVATTVGFVVILLILVLAVLVTVLLCVRQGLCVCLSKKPPAGQAPTSPAREPTDSRANRSPLVSSSSVRSNNQRGGHSTHSPNAAFNLPHSHHHHHSHHSHHHHSHSHTSPRRYSNNNNGHVVGAPVDHTMTSNNSGTSIGDSSAYSQHHNMRSASMGPPLPNNISPYPGMPFPYQPCKSPVTAYGGGGMGYTIHPQIPRTPTSASITTLSTLSTTHNQRHVTSNGIVVVEERGERGGNERHVVGGDRSHAGGRDRAGSERAAGGGGREVRDWRIGGGDVEEERRGVSDGAGAGGRGGGMWGDEERGGRGRVDGGERETNRSGGGDTAQVQRSPVTHRQVELDDSINNNPPPLQLYSTQV